MGVYNKWRLSGSRSRCECGITKEGLQVNRVGRERVDIVSTETNEEIYWGTGVVQRLPVHRQPSGRRPSSTLLAVPQRVQRSLE